MAELGLTWERGAHPVDMAADVRDYGRRLLAAILRLAEFFAIKVESWAKRNAPWTDRTGNARSGLTARALRAAAGAVLVLFGTVEYQKWLELANAGRFAIIDPTLTHFSPEIMSALRRLVGA